MRPWQIALTKPSTVRARRQNQPVRSVARHYGALPVSGLAELADDRGAPAELNPAYVRKLEHVTDGS